jgi:hypothetical protein
MEFAELFLIKNFSAGGSNTKKAKLIKRNVFPVATLKRFLMTTSESCVLGECARRDRQTASTARAPITRLRSQNKISSSARTSHARAQSSKTKIISGVPPPLFITIKTINCGLTGVGRAAEWFKFSRAKSIISALNFMLPASVNMNEKTAAEKDKNGHKTKARIRRLF